MKAFFRKLLKLVAYSAASLVILLAILVGLFRLFLPRLPEYQDDIENWASTAIGMEVQFSGMNARWGLSGPEIEFYDTELIRPDSQTRAIAAELVSVGISVTSLLFDQKVVVDRVVIRDTSIEIRQLENGGWWIQGSALDELPRARTDGSQRLGDMEVVGQDIEIRFLQPGDERPHFFRVPNVLVSIDENRIALDADVRLPDYLGRSINLAATHLRDLPDGQRGWDVSAEADNIALQGWSQLHPVLDGRVFSGGGDINLSFAVSGNSVSNASVDVNLEDVSFAVGQVFDLSGRFELDRSFDGWLVAAQDFRIAREGREWPRSSLRAEANTDATGEIAVLSARASYLHLDDMSLLLPLLPEAQRDFLADLAPAGEVSDLDVTVSEFGADVPYFDITVDLENVGFAASGKRPGISGFSGHINGDRPGGRIEVRSRDMIIELPQVHDGPVDIDVLNGMIIWRSNDELTRFTSDSVRIANAIFESRGGGELTFYKDAPPFIEYSSSFSVSDVSAFYPYLPHKVMKPKLKNWLQTALVRGSISRGTLRMNGVLEKGFFRNKSGNLLMEGSARDVTLKFHPNWPAVERADAELVLENTRLYSVKNRSVSVGNVSVDSSVEIDDLLNPVLTIKALTTGTLGTMHQYALRSRLNEMLGGHLERVTVDGDASFQFDLMVPLRHAVDATIDGVLRSNNGSMSIDGFPAPIDDLIGEVTITRDYLESDNLGGRFLGQEVDIALDKSDDPSLFAVATVTGLLTSRAIVEDLDVPLEGLIDGAADYTARVLFPRGGQEAPRPFTIEIDTALQGLALDLPDPVGKPAADSLQLSGELVFMPGGELIESIGRADNGIAWHLSFSQPEGTWDFDRGVLMAGTGEMTPAETRGLHIRGETTTVRLEDWLNLSRSGDRKVGAADRIRSIDLKVADLFAIGQHLQDHHVRLDRSALDWLVQIEGDDVTGSVFVPYDFGAERAIVVEMEHMRLPGDDVTPPSVSTLDPRKLPPITLTVADFALGDRNLGAVEMSLVKTDEGLETERLIATDESYGIVGAGRWVADANEELGSRTYVMATLNSHDVRTTLARLDFSQGISGESMGVVFDLSWAGGPRASFLDELDGKMQMRLENGALEEVEPGAGRMLGLVSFVALPRRLSLDFRDVFNKGFRYDSIAGNFVFDDGIASTCDMSLEGPAALIGVVGQVDLANSQYEQGAVVSAKVGNTLPIVGAVVGGPPGAAAMLIFSQIFKKPLQSVGEVYYGISGPWEEPLIDAINTDAFVHYGDLAGCLSGTERQ
jgi:uncharacterized protein (TIGR02099 family)